MSLILSERSSQQLSYSNIAQETGVSVDTIRRWIELLERLHFGFRVRPWSTHIAKALRKEPRKAPVVVPAKTLLSQLL